MYSFYHGGKYYLVRNAFALKSYVRFLFIPSTKENAMNLRINFLSRNSILNTDKTKSRK